MADTLDISALVRANILHMKPYTSARDEYSGAAKVFMDANENPYNSPLNRYPDPRQSELKKKIAGIKGISPDYLFLGNGSDEGIDLLFRVFCEPSTDNVITVDPTYGMYGVCAEIQGVERRSVMLNPDFSLDPEAVLRAMDQHTKLLFLCSPNNPTSNSYDRRALVSILERAGCLVVVDEAYIDFSRDPGLLDLVPRKKNLVVLQTLSKAWGLAGIRLGMLFAHPQLVEYISRVKYPYNINRLTIDTALQALNEDGEKRRGWIGEILKERSWMTGQLEYFPFVIEVFPSDANFLLIRVEDPAGLHQFLLEQGIIVRNRSSVPLCEGCLRVTIGTKEENRALVEALKTFKK
jgi:histidinol-phosphate aminotransferase